MNGVVNFIRISSKRFYQFIKSIDVMLGTISSDKRAPVACAPRLADTMSAGGVLWAPGVTLINYRGKNISKYVCPTVIIDITRKITKFVNL